MARTIFTRRAPVPVARKSCSQRGEHSLDVHRTTELARHQPGGRGPSMRQVDNTDERRTANRKSAGNGTIVPCRDALYAAHVSKRALNAAGRSDGDSASFRL